MEIGTVRIVDVEREMRQAYLDYAMSVITARALPDVRDGLKPVQRRILHSMAELGLRHDTRYRKCAGIVGEVLKNYHPHGDSAVYDALVRMVQDFSMRYPLIDGQGNFGSVDDDPPAAYRYTEARMTEIAEEMLADLDKNTVDFVPNFDGMLREPTVLPAKLPNLLLNGAAGIAVGMATNIPPHNLNEICDGVIHLIDNPDANVEDLMAFVQGPDFPTAGIIHGLDGIKKAYSTGHGRIVLSARVQIEEMARAGRFQIVITELPYQVNKAALQEKIAELVKEKRIEGITELRDESDRQGMRVVIELRRDCQPRQVLNKLFKYTTMRTAFSVNMLALVDGQPRVLTLKMVLQHFISHRQQVLTRRTQFELAKARERAHILEGLKIALDHLDEVIATIRRSQNAETARTNLMKGFHLTEAQAQAILEMQLRRLAALERKKILDELAEVLKNIRHLEELLADPAKILKLIKDDLKALKQKYGDPRRTRIIAEEAGDFTEEDLIPDEDVVVTMTGRGYAKRVPIDTFKAQRRGGRGITGMQTREADSVRLMLIANTHASVLFFTDRGRVFQVKCHELPDASRTAKGVPLINVISIDPEEQVTAAVAVKDFGRREFMVMTTRRGEIKKTALDEFAAVRSNGLIAMDLEPGDSLGWVRLVHRGEDLILTTEQGHSIRFRETDLRAASRLSGGVRAVRLEDGDHVAGMDVVEPGGELLIISAAGYGKRTPLAEFPTHGRGGGGVRVLKVTPRTGRIVGARVVDPEMDAFIVSKEGIVIRTAVGQISQQGRAAQGVQVMRLGAGDEVVALALLSGQEKEPTTADGGGDKARARAALEHSVTIARPAK